ncbi:MAG: hypothetical protein S4CHLAM2_01330 [Chlamydiales bacterium]|nr:hypothetical protein [Chlamydiales bacterium]
MSGAVASDNSDYPPLLTGRPQRLSETELQAKWDQTAIILIQRIGNTLSRFRLEAKKREGLAIQLIEGHIYSFGSVSNLDDTPYCVFAFDRSLISDEIPPSPPEMTDQERREVAELASVINGIIEQRRYLNKTMEGSISIPALLATERVSKIEDSLLCQKFALESMQGEYQRHPEHVQASKSCCVVL